MMDIKKIDIQIDAAPEKVWEALWAADNYSKWASIFNQGSHAVSDWRQGSEIKFLDGQNNGIYSHITTLTPNREMAFTHQGEIKAGVETPADWGGAKERYLLTPKDGGTLLMAEIDGDEELLTYFEELLPKALKEIKKIAEGL